MSIIKVEKINTLFHAIEIYEQISTNIHQECLLDFSETQFIRNNYLSIIGLAIEERKVHNKHICVIPPDFNRNRKVYTAMSNIGFLEEFLHTGKSIDYHRTMVKYTHINLNSEHKITDFYEHFVERFQNHIGNLSPQLLNKIIQKIYELFSNVFRHSQSELGLFCSGQFYPANKKFNFTIVDGGITIPTNVNKFLLKKFKEELGFGGKLRGREFKPLDGVSAIKWAMEEKNSTSGEGGLGLSLLKQLIIKSGGKLEIISKKGYYAISDGIYSYHGLQESFPGTIVSIELKTDESKYYYLKGEA